jgi:AcrR family transcriptional regulator
MTTTDATETRPVPPRGSYAAAAREAAKERLRNALLDAAYDAIVGPGWDSVRMADVAAAVGVSRQTLYNEFGDKDGLAQELVMRETHRFLDGIDAALGTSDDIASAVVAAVEFTLQAAADNPLLKAVLASARGTDDLLPFLTTRSEPVLVAARAKVADYVLTRDPERDPADVALVAESLVRLTVSHLVLPTAPVETTARQLALLVSRALGVPFRTPATPIDPATPEEPA